VGKSLLVANLALLLAAGQERAGFAAPVARRVLMCQFELPTPQFVARLAAMRRALGTAADHHLLVDTRATGHLLSAPQGLHHFLGAARAAAAEVIVLDPLYSAHDQDENDTRAMAALCQSLLKLRETSKVALIVVHHVRKSVGRDEIGSAFRGSSALHAVRDSYLLLARPSTHLAQAAIELRFQFRYAATQPSRLLSLDPQRYGFPRLVLRPRKHPRVLRWSSATLLRRSTSLAAKPATISSASRSWISPTVPNAPRNWLLPTPAARASLCKTTANIACRFDRLCFCAWVALAQTLPRGSAGSEAEATVL
jgi:hypothetical protein